MDANDEAGRRIPPPATTPASLAKCALRRQTPEVGAECPNWARSDLCGGRSAMRVPTANNAGAGPNGGYRGGSPCMTVAGSYVDLIEDAWNLFTRGQPGGRGSKTSAAAPCSSQFKP